MRYRYNLNYVMLSYCKSSHVENKDFYFIIFFVNHHNYFISGFTIMVVAFLHLSPKYYVYNMIYSIRIHKTYI